MWPTSDWPSAWMRTQDLPPELRPIASTNQITTNASQHVPMREP